MTSRERQFILQVVENLCEEIATQKEIERLQAITLQDRDALRLYIEAMELHGELYWDAAGAGSTEMPVYKPSAPPQEEPVSVKRPTRRLFLIPAIGASLLLLATISFWPRNNGQSASVDLAQSEHSVTHSDSSNTDSAGPSIIPEITLPAVPMRNGENSQADNIHAVSIPSRPNKPTRPLPSSDTGIVQLINNELQQMQKEAGVSAGPVASDSEWIRRIYLDVAGRIPTTKETEQFLNSNQDNKRADVLDRLLVNPEFARHQASVWTNLLVGRARVKGIHRETLYAWLNRQFRENRPWRDTVEELIAAVGTQENGPANFLLAHLNNQAVPATAIAARILLCQQLQCAQCHQHPEIKNWEQSKFWELNAFFQQTKIKESMAFDPKKNETIYTRELVNNDTFGPTFYESLKGVLQVAYPSYSGVEVMTEPRSPLRDQLADLLFSGDHPQTARAFVNRTWAQFFGYGFTNPIDNMGPQTPVSHPELLEQLTAAFVASDYDVKRLVRWICLSDAYQLSSQVPEKQLGDTPELGDFALFTRMYVKPLTAEQLYDSLLIANTANSSTLFDRQVESNREEWLSRFYTSVETEENSESSTFDGTLTQALMMINGDLVLKATDIEKSRVLSQVINHRGWHESERIRQLSLAALSRVPSEDELNKIGDLVKRSIRAKAERNIPYQVALAESLKDVYWAYLNSSEFAVNH
ncbi:DUF1553 domain-containing protein [Planctomicrobium sp. SH527]|uniref:DUF1553 domain-containing protein n=1 Tax=Planctomicrobium sp. SH527 TaxID=3448123 RepID=UPI003F5B648F